MKFARSHLKVLTVQKLHTIDKKYTIRNSKMEPYDNIVFILHSIKHELFYYVSLVYSDQTLLVQSLK